MAATTYSFSPAVYSVSSSFTKVETSHSILYPQNPNFFKPNAAVKNSNAFRFSRLRISHKTAVKPLGNDDSEAYAEPGPSFSSPSTRVDSLSDESAMQEATAIDLKLPRRRLMVQFTCDACGESTQRLINRLAYDRGTVFVQCAGCLQHHKLVDNLGLLVEYNLREETNMDPNTDQV